MSRFSINAFKCAAIVAFGGFIIGQIMLFYASMVIIGLIALIKILPETKNRSIEEIEAALIRE